MADVRLVARKLKLRPDAGQGPRVDDGPVEGGGLVMTTSIQGGVTRHAVLTLTERHGLASGWWSSAPMVVMLCVPFLLIGGTALIDALRDQLWARVALVGLAGLVATVTVVGIASIGLLLAPTTLLAAASAATASTRRRRGGPGRVPTPR